MLDVLPDDILTLLLTEWNDLPTVKQLDTALVNCVIRKRYLRLRKPMSVPLKFTNMMIERKCWRQLQHWGYTRNATWSQLEGEFRENIPVGQICNNFQELNTLNLSSWTSQPVDLLVLLLGLRKLEVLLVGYNIPLHMEKQTFIEAFHLKRLVIRDHKFAGSVSMDTLERIAPFCSQLESLELRRDVDRVEMSWDRFCSNVLRHFPRLKTLYISGTWQINIGRTPVEVLEQAVPASPVDVFPHVKCFTGVLLDNSGNAMNGTGQFLLSFPMLNKLDLSLWSCTTLELPFIASWFQQLHTLKLNALFFKCTILCKFHPYKLPALKTLELQCVTFADATIAALIRSLCCLERLTLCACGGMSTTALQALLETVEEQPTLAYSLQHLTLKTITSAEDEDFAQLLIQVLGRFRWKSLMLIENVDCSLGLYPGCRWLSVWKYLINDYPFPETIELFHFEGDIPSSLVAPDAKALCDEIHNWRCMNVKKLFLYNVILSEELHQSLKHFVFSLSEASYKIGPIHMFSSSDQGWITHKTIQ